MVLQLKKAHRGKAYLKLGIAAPSGGGKTLSALLIAYGLLKEKYPKMPDSEIWSKIAIIDTENGSGELYVGADVANTKIGEYNAITLNPPFEADKYTQAIKMCKDAEMEVCIIDSTTHLWSGEGGLLDQQGHIAKRTGNSYTAWREITPQHNRFIDAMLRTPIHIIATMRSKQEYVQEKDSGSGKTTIRKVGLEPEQRKGMEYEFTTFFEINAEHEAFGSKDRTSVFDQKTFTITPETGQKIMRWLEGGKDAPVEVIMEAAHKADPTVAKQELKDEIIGMCKELGGQSNEELMETLRRYVPSANPNAIKEVKKLTELKDELELLKSRAELLPT